jgi:hypothetical protein
MPINRRRRPSKPTTPATTARPVRTGHGSIADLLFIRETCNGTSTCPCFACLRRRK